MRIRQEGTAAVPESELEADFRAARDLGKVRVGERGVFLQKFSGVTFLPFGALERVWLRQEEVNARLCCGTANFDQFFLMLRGRDGQVRKGQVLSKELGKEALARIAAAAPEVESGYDGERVPQA